jgi:aspartyl-tRNA(Asn)/glutamyl-tRNA(Gln) amidotransferase subunit B
MIAEEVRKQYTATIGIECHVQLKTKTKLFSAVGNDARQAAPNTLISHIDLGMPGALPVLNEKAVELAIKAAFALGTEPQHFSKFDRKHYFYPDLPKGYQISQFDQPIILGGHVDIWVEGEQKRINITRAHMEEDAGKSTHPAGKDYSLVDLNRAGTPLLEIVSEPEIHSAEEAKAYARELWLLMRYAAVSDADLYHGNMRFDVNVSVSKTDELGTRSETKNLNSFKSVEKAVEFEINRQIELLEKGEQVVQETRGWDDAKQKTFSQRTKEDAHDYRYFPEPDLPPIVIEQKTIDEAKAAMPPLPNTYRQLFGKLNLDSSAVESLVNSPETAAFIKGVMENQGEDHAKRIANWIVNTVSKQLEGEEAETAPQLPSADKAAKLSQMVADNKLSSTAAKDVWLEMTAKGGDPEEIAEAKNLVQVSDEGAIAEIVAKVLAENPKAAEDVKNGEMKAIGFLVGQIMKASQGKANPALAQELIKKQLGQNG